MGVMKCSRKDCDNLLCETYISGVGYICSDCKAEFINYMTDKYGDRKLDSDLIEELLTKFMQKKRSSNYETTVEDFFNNQ